MSCRLKFLLIFIVVQVAISTLLVAQLYGQSETESARSDSSGIHDGYDPQIVVVIPTPPTPPPTTSTTTTAPPPPDPQELPDPEQELPDPEQELHDPEQELPDPERQELPDPALITNPTLTLSLYYETLCPYCQKFIAEYLHPLTHSDLGPYFQLDLIPYGNARTITSTNKKKGKDTYKFRCQHGPKECEGNMMHACALKHILSEEKQLDFIQCTMGPFSSPKSERPALLLNKCGKEVGGVSSIAILNCMQDGEGRELLAEYGEMTKSLEPPMRVTPWVTFNGIYSRNNTMEMWKSLKSVVCKELRGLGVDPEPCE